jgi:hypothetical protein
VATSEGFGSPPNWHPDPSGRHQLRYWDGSNWTDHVSDGGVTVTDPLTAPDGAQAGWAGQSQYGPIPGTPWMAASPQPVAHSLKGLSTALTVLLALSAAASLAFSIALFARVSLLDDPFSMTLEEANDADNAVAATSVVFVATILASGVVWLIWQFRHAKNARLLGQRGGLTPGWAIGGWFIPCASLVLGPLQIHQAAKASDPDSVGDGEAPPIVVLWWVLMVVSWIAGSVSNRFGDDEVVDDLSDVERFQSSDRTAAFVALLFIATAVTAIVMIRTLTARQHRALESRGLLP